MGKLALIIAIAIALTAALYIIVYKLAAFKNSANTGTTVQKLLFWFIVLYTPVQLMVLMMAGHKMPLANTKDHTVFAAAFSLSHAIMAVMGMVAATWFYKRYKFAALLIAFNAMPAVFYFMAALIFMRVTQ